MNTYMNGKMKFRIRAHKVFTSKFWFSEGFRAIRSWNFSDIIVTKLKYFQSIKSEIYCHNITLTSKTAALVFLKFTLITNLDGRKETQKLHILSSYIPLRVTTTFRALGSSRCSHSHIPWNITYRNKISRNLVGK